MCAAYWAVIVTDLRCPGCGKIDDWELQTHFMGYDGTSALHFDIGQPVPLLHGMTVRMRGGYMDPDEDDGSEIAEDFISDCPACRKFFHFGAEVVGGAIMSVFPLEEPASEREHEYP